MEEKSLITIHRDSKYGGFDFGIRGTVSELTQDEITDFRATCMVAFRVADNMWMQKQEENNPPAQESKCEN